MGSFRITKHVVKDEKGKIRHYKSGEPEYEKKITMTSFVFTCGVTTLLVLIGLNIAYQNDHATLRNAEEGISMITRYGVPIICMPYEQYETKLNQTFGTYIANNEIENLALNFNISINFDEEFLEEWQNY